VDSVMPTHQKEASRHFTGLDSFSTSTDRPGERGSFDSRNSGDFSPLTSGSFTTGDNKYDESHPKLILCTAKNDVYLEKTIKALKGIIATQPLQDIAYTLSFRSKFSHRAIALVEAGSEPIFNHGAVTEDVQLDFIFTGQGAQWPQMGKELLDFPIFRESIRQIDDELANLPMAPSWTVEEMLKADLTASEMDEPRIAQLMSIALKIAVVDLLADWNVFPTSVAGHSAGEIAAAYTAGYLTRGEAVAVAYYRGYAVSESELLPGGMLAVGLSTEESEKLLPENGKVVIGAINSPRSVTLSGDADTIQAIKQDLDDKKIFNRLLATKGRAYHSPHMENAAEAYGVPLHDIERAQAKPKIRARYFSTVTGTLWTEDEILCRIGAETWNLPSNSIKLSPQCEKQE
jgi:acyl transferase domain-containing protein